MVDRIRAHGKTAGMTLSLLSFLRKEAGMSFTRQDRPEKTKDIYKALKRDHPGMPAEMKARIALRKSRKTLQARRSPKGGGPAYKAPIQDRDR